MTEANERVRPAVFDLSLSVEGLDRASADFDSLTVGEAVEHLSVVKEDITKLRQLEAALERWVAECFKAEGWRDPVEFPGLGVVEVRRSTTRRAWRHEDAASDFVNALIAESGGEADTFDPFLLMERFRGAASVSGWKVGAFKALGLNVNDYAQTEPGAPTVQIVRAS